MGSDKATVDAVIDIIVTTLGIENRADSLDATTPLFNSMPELHSMAVVALAVALEREFDLEIDDEDLTAEVFETVGTLAEFVEAVRDTGRLTWPEVG
ncbi:acyl carrier protein [Mycobacterium sp. 4D054]|uniref:acyl carrier protein n=1 Tax=unclassified Mycobacterium TaxID=2642494 RepID=UPI0021B31B43|nr:acyl carrier protein [Mycobacterium sp. SMC-8]UXA12952.1 acyl carrier protein [Mycobacterium sp. SMC-8]